MSEQRHAFLVLAHGAPEQTARLLSALDRPNFSFVVHVDIKTAIEPFEEHLSSLDVTFTSRRFDVWRKCWSMIEATEELMSTALSLDDRFGYLSLISGADYPVASPDRITTILDGAEVEYLHFFEIADRPDWYSRVERRHYPDHAYLEQHNDGSLGTKGRIAANKLLRIGHRLRSRHDDERPVPGGLTLCGGSQWWTLTSDAVTYLLDRMELRAEREFFRFTDGPDELYLQTLLYNSPFRSRLAAIEAYRDWQGSTSTEMLPEALFNLRHIDWSVEREEHPAEGGVKRGPTTFDDRDFDELAASNAIFARKMHPERSATLLDRIDAELLSSPR